MSSAAGPKDIAGLSIEVAVTPADAALISAIFDEVWSVRSMVSPEIMVAALHNGAYGAVAWRDGKPVGAAFALVGLPLDGQTMPNLHSHAAGVVASAANGGIGYALKFHQFSWAKQHGFSTVTWTFDPLVRRNAWFNIVKLGTKVLGYHQNFYGELDDGINAGEQSDRLLVRWDVVGFDAPHSATFVQTGIDDVRIATPVDIESLRKTDSAVAANWREQQRAAFDKAKDAGLSVIGLDEDYCYVLRSNKDGGQ
jgi:predicted GNAT superfamily acetyltransferase